MADNATTVDELALEISAKVTTAVSAIKDLSAAIVTLNAALGPAMGNLKELKATLNAAKGAAPGLRAVMKATGAATRDVGVQAKAATNELRRMVSYAQTARGSIRVMPTSPFPAAPFTAPKPALSPVPLNNVTAQANATKVAVDKVTNSVEKMGTRGVKSTNFLSQSFIQLRSKIFFALFAITMLGNAFRVFIGAATEYIEKVNLFGVTMGEVAGEADAFASRIENSLGIDPGAFRESYSTFYMMAHSLGMTADAANKVSQNFTQLAYDYASLREMKFSDVEAKFRSAMAGQTRAVASLGLDVTLTSLAQEALREGISGNVAQFTKANKIILMHNLIMRQSQVVHGDLARTITSPSNMLRILKDQFAIAARTIGFLFIPMLQAVLPWLITLTNALTMAARAFLGLFGISMPSWEAQVGGAVGGVDDLFDGMSGVEDATGGAADNMKKLRDYTLGIDELNILEPPTDTGGPGSGSPGGPGVGGPSIDPVDVYDMIGGIDGLKKIMEPVLEIFEKLGKALKPFIDAIGRAWEAFKPFISNVWKGFTAFYTQVLLPLAVWTMNTVGVAVLDAFTAVLNWFNEHPGTAEALGFVVAALTTLGAVGKISGLWNLVAFFSAIGPEFSFFQKLAMAFPTIAGFFSAAWGTITGVFSAFVAGGAAEGFAALAAAIGPTGWIALGIAAVIGVGTLLWQNWDTITAKAKELWGNITQTWEDIKTTTTTAWDNIVSYFTGVWDTIETTFAGPIDFVTKLISRAWEEISTTTEKVWNWISSVLETVWETIVAIVSIPVAMIGTLIITSWNWLSTETTRIWGIISGTLRTLWNGIITFMTPIWNTIKGVVAAVWDWLKDATKSAWEWVWDKIEGPVNDIKNLVDRVFPVIKSTIRDVWDNLTDGLEGAWNTIKSTFRTGANSIIRSINEGPIAVLNGIIAAAKEADITGVMAGVSYVSKIPYLARGGVVGLGQMFIAGESGAELVGSYGGSKSTVMPLEESGFVEAMASAVFSATVAAMSSSSSGGSGDVYLNGQVVGQILRDDERRSGVGASLVKVSI
jgi:phage-related protein